MDPADAMQIQPRFDRKIQSDELSFSKQAEPATDDEVFAHDVQLVKQNIHLMETIYPKNLKEKKALDALQTIS
jgi:hypothetical protein